MENLKIMVVESFDFFADVWVAVELEDWVGSCLVFIQHGVELRNNSEQIKCPNSSTYADILTE